MAHTVHAGYDDGGFPYSMRDLLTIVFKRRWLILAVLVTVVSSVLVLGLTKPRSYTVTAKLLVNEARAELPIAPTDSSQLILNRVTEEDLNSEIEVLRSPKLLEDVVRRVSEQVGPPSRQPDNSGLDIPEASSLQGGGENALEGDALVLHLQKAVKISAIRKSNVIQVVYSSSDPNWAARIVEALVEEYLQQRVERYQSPQAVVFFEQQMNDAEDRLTRQERALEKFVDEAAITIVKGPIGTDALAAQKNLVMTRLNKLENDLGDAKAELEEQRFQISRLRLLLAGEPERLQSASRYNRDTTIEEIERRLAELKLERDALLQDFKPDSRYVSDIERQIQMAEAMMEESSASRSGIDGTEINPVYLKLKGDLLQAEVALDGAAARVTSLQSQVNEHREVLARLNDRTFELGRLTREASTAREDYLLYRKKYEEARISAAMDQERFINVTVAQPAQVPLMPEPRGLATKLVFALAVGLLGGLGLAFVLEEYIDRSFTVGEDIERRLGMAHIASIPEGDVAA